MGAWYEALSGLEQFLLLTGIFSTLIFALQFLLTLFGIGEDDSDFDSEGGEGGEGGLALGDVFTLRNGVSFLMGFSWGGLMAYGWFASTLLAAVVGFAIGMGFVVINMLLLVGMAQLKHDGSIHLENAINTEATVTLPVPGERSGVGKVMVPIQGRLKEYHAVTDGAALSRNATVIVLAVLGDQLVVASRQA